MVAGAKGCVIHLGDSEPHTIQANGARLTDAVRGSRWRS